MPNILGSVAQRSKQVIADKEAYEVESASLQGNATGYEAFLEMVGVSRLRPCAQTHFKKALCNSHSFGWASDKYR